MESKQQGVKAPAQKQAAIVFATEPHGGKVTGKVIPVMACGNLPKNGIEQGAGGNFVPGTTTFSPLVLRTLRRLQGGKAGGDLIVFLKNHQIVKLAAGLVAGELPAVGGNDEGRLTVQMLEAGVGRDERGEKRPLLIGEAGGVVGMVGREGGQVGRMGGISDTLFRNGKKRIGVTVDTPETVGGENPTEGIMSQFFKCALFQNRGKEGIAGMHAETNHLEQKTVRG